MEVVMMVYLSCAVIFFVSHLDLYYSNEKYIFLVLLGSRSDADVC